MRSLFFLLSAAFALIPMASAVAEPMWPGEAQVELKNMVARVHIIPENRDDVDIKVRYGNARVPTLLVSRKGDTIILNGQINTDLPRGGFKMTIKVQGDPNSKSFRFVVPNQGHMNMSDAPEVFIRVPNDARIKEDGIIYGDVAPSQNLEIISCGQGVWKLDTVKDTLSIVSCGSTDFQAERAENILINGSGSGDFYITKAIRLKANMTGSGDMVIDSARSVEIVNSGAGDNHINSANEAFLKLSGAGDVSLQRMIGPLRIESNGNGDVHVDTLLGPVVINMAGSGDVTIEDGKVPSIEIKGYGSGDVRFGGMTDAVTVDSYGSGDVYVMKAYGKVITRVRGSGDMHIGR